MIQVTWEGGVVCLRSMHVLTRSPPSGGSKWASEVFTESSFGWNRQVQIVNPLKLASSLATLFLIVVWIFNSMREYWMELRTRLLNYMQDYVLHYIVLMHFLKRPWL